jgi:hypothetical protein
MKKFLITTTLLLAFGSVPAKAVTATFCGPDSEGGTCEGAVELKVFLDKNPNTTLGFGEVGGPKATTTIDFASDGGLLNNKIDLADGFATIKPAHGFVDFNGLDITIPGFTFTDIAFDVQLTPTDSRTDSFTISDFSGKHVLDAIGTEFDKADTDKQFSTTAVGGAFDEVNIRSLTGFDEIKHIEISGLEPIVSSTVPEPSTWAMMALGFAGLGLLGYRKTRSDNALA